MSDWDKNKWQGRSKKQVENNIKVTDLIFVLLLLVSLCILFFG